MPRGINYKRKKLKNPPQNSKTCKISFSNKRIFKNSSTFLIFYHKRYWFKQRKSNQALQYHTRIIKEIGLQQYRVILKDSCNHEKGVLQTNNFNQNFSVGFLINLDTHFPGPEILTVLLRKKGKLFSIKKLMGNVWETFSEFNFISL